VTTQSISDPALSLNRDSCGTEYLVNPGHSSVWITIDNISVYLRRHDWGVCIDLYPIEQEDADSLAIAILIEIRIWCKLMQLRKIKFLMIGKEFKKPLDNRKRLAPGPKFS